MDWTFQKFAEDELTQINWGFSKDFVDFVPLKNNNISDSFKGVSVRCDLFI